MALTLTQAAQVRHFLGIPDGLEVWVSFEAQLAATSAENLVIVIDLLAKLAAIDTQLASAPSRLKAIKVGSITLSQFGEIEGLRAEGRRLASRLASVYGISPVYDVFGEGGDSMGGVIPLG
jgi:hypothetical protein